MEAFNFDDPFILQARIVDQEDVNQEAALLRLQGIMPNRRIIRLKMSQGEPTFSGDPGSLAQPISTVKIAPMEVIEMIISWALQQVPELAKEILDFLDEPSETVLQALIERVRQDIPGGSVKRTSAAPGSLSAVIFKYLQEPKHIDELYELARGIHTAERPEAAVRQYLRRAVRAGKVTKSGDTYVATQARGASR